MNNKFFQIAHNLSARNIGKTSDNPSVGAVIVKNNQIIGYGITAIGGRPHAEHIALEMAGARAKGADIYVTLKPCTSEGRSGACSRKLQEADIKNIYVLQDDPTQMGQLDSKEITVEGNVAFLKKAQTGLPYVTVKIATSLDGKIALANGQSKWITGEVARNYAHKLRAKHDAILVGSNTWVEDNPKLDCRLQGLEDFSPKIYVVSRGTITGSNVLSTSSMKENLKQIAKESCNSVLIEGGGKVIASLIKNGLVDRLEWLKAPIILGADSRDAVAELGLESMEDKIKLKPIHKRRLGDDTLEVYQL